MRKYVNWLVLFFIVVVAGSILVPAFVHVRDEAKRTQCRFNLMQIGLAVHNYHDTLRHFPLAAKPNLGLTPEHRLSWFYSILPYVVGKNNFKEFDESKAWDAQENEFGALTVEPVYQCPGFSGKPPTSRFVPTHYLGISGIGKDAAWLPKGNPKAGFFGYDRKISFEDVKDGTSYTLMAIETAWPSGAWTAGGPDTVRCLDPEGSPYLSVPGQFGGNHRGGTNALFADGSVHFLKTPFDPASFEALATIAGGETISNEEFKVDHPD